MTQTTTSYRLSTMPSNRPSGAKARILREERNAPSAAGSVPRMIRKVRIE